MGRDWKEGSELFSRKTTLEQGGQTPSWDKESYGRVESEALSDDRGNVMILLIFSG